MVEAGLEYDQCTPEELNAKELPSGKPLWELLAQVEESKWNRDFANDTRTKPAQRIFFKVGRLSPTHVLQALVACPNQVFPPLGCFASSLPRGSWLSTLSHAGDCR